MSERISYISPLVSRYASREMAELFGERHRILTWRRVWLALAEAQRRAGLQISDAQISELKHTLNSIDFDAAARHEQRLRHDVMAHLHAWADVAPSAGAILHLGATSMDIVDNADLVILRDALKQVGILLANVVDALGHFSARFRDLPTLGYTHYQPAQVTTVGKRATLWASDFVRDLSEVEYRLDSLRFRGIKGATGTQATFLSLMGGDASKVAALEAEVARQFDFSGVEPVTGQTYSRQIDACVAATLACIATSVHKLSNDLRLLANLKEMEEPFEESQVGSSAMPYKRNPMLCERAAGLSRFVIALAQSAFQTAAEQWLERTLDDSANKRLTVPEAFLAVDAMLRIVVHVARGMVVYPGVIGARLRAELPFMATEEILLAVVAQGGDRQEIHERIRRHAQAAGARVKQEGAANDLLERLAGDPEFNGVDFARLVEPARFVGLAPRQVDEFIRDFIDPVRRRYASHLNLPVTIHV